MGCTVVEPDGNNPFATAAVPMTSATPATDTNEASGSGSGSDDGSGGSGGGTTDGGGTTMGMVDSSGDGVVGTTTGVTTAGSTSGDGDGGGGAQPGMGMYSPCAAGADCGFLPNLCLTISDAGGVVIDGFCTETGCANAAVDCDPSPGGTAAPICINVTVNDLPDTACALNCAGGATCPVGMTCYNLTGIGEVCG